MDDSGSWLVRGFASYAFSMAWGFVSAGVTTALVLYVIARWRAHREAEPDAQLGAKFALHCFALLASQVVFGGLAILVYAAISDAHHSGELARAAFGLLVPAAGVLGLALLLLAQSNDGVATGVRRLFVGLNTMLTGLVTFAGLVAGCEVLLAKDGGDGVGSIAAAIVVPYGSATALLALVMSRLIGPRPDRFAIPTAPPAQMPLPRD